MFAEDLSVFFDEATGFAVQATLAGAPLLAIADTMHVRHFDSGAITEQPTALVRADQAPAAAAGQAFTLGAVNYSVRAVQAELPDGAVKRLVLVRV